LDQAQAIDPNFEMTYVYRGKIYQATGNNAAAADQFKRALALNPYNSDAREALNQVSR
jgi:Tfp pilus assembly protein PilF